MEAPRTTRGRGPRGDTRAALRRDARRKPRAFVSTRSSPGSRWRAGTPAARGRTGREAAPRERWPGFAKSGREAKARRGSTPIPRAQPRAARRASRSPPPARPRAFRATASRAATRRAEPSEEARNGARPRPRPRPRGPRRRGRGRARREGQGGFLLGFLPPSERGLRSPLELRRHGVALQRDARSVVSRRCVRACFTRSSACFVVKGDREAARSAVGGDSGAAIGGSAIVSSERRTGAGTSLRYDSANVSSDASNEPSSSSPDAREATRTALDAAGERTGFGFGAAAADAAAAAARTASRRRRRRDGIARAAASASSASRSSAAIASRLPTLPPRSERRRRL